jgi:ComF family protein
MARLCRGIRCAGLSFARARSAAVYDGAVRSSIHALKFGRHRQVAEVLGGLMADLAVYDLVLAASRVVVPVPLHPSRMRERGFNQAELLAGPVAMRLELPIRPELLRKVVNTPAQSTLSAKDRHATVTGSFAPGAPVEHVAILLIDDVLSTGATASECARVLLAAGAGQVTVLTAAAAVLP